MRRPFLYGRHTFPPVFDTFVVILMLIVMDPSQDLLRARSGDIFFADAKNGTL